MDVDHFFKVVIFSPNPNHTRSVWGLPSPFKRGKVFASFHHIFIIASAEGEVEAGVKIIPSRIEYYFVQILFDFFKDI